MAPLSRNSPLNLNHSNSITSVSNLRETNTNLNQNLRSTIYPLICRNKKIVPGALTFAALMGGYHWSMHVLAEAAKYQIEPLTTWFGIETIYLMIQFLLGSFWMAFIYRPETKS